MDNWDDLLEKKMEMLQSGQSVEDVIHSLPPEAVELEPLIRLAADARAVTRPILKPQVIREQKKSLRTAQRAAPKFSFPRWSLPKVFSAAAIMALVAFTIAGMFLASPASASYATVTETTGSVQVLRNASDSTWTTLTAGDRVKPGQSIRTGPDSIAAIQFFDGSRSFLADNAEVRLDHVGGGFGKSIQVEILQTSGVTNYNVVPIHGIAGYFRVKTPFGSADVHGTEFQVDVRSNTRISVSHGVVAVNSQQQQVILSDGQATIVLENTPPQAPAYEFAFQDRIYKMDDLWSAGGISFKVPPEVLAGQSFQPGEMIKVTGRFKDGAFTADRVQPANGGNSVSQLTGVIESLSPDQWVISGETVQIDDDVHLKPGIQVGDVVSVLYRIMPDHSKRVTAITVLENRSPVAGKPTKAGASGSESKRKSTPAEEKKQEKTTWTPELSQPTETTTPSQEPVPTENHSGCGDNPQGHPEIQTLSQQYRVSPDEVSAWFCQGFGFGEIDQAYNLAIQTNTPVSQIFTLRSSGMGWGQILHDLQPDAPSKSNKPKD